MPAVGSSSKRSTGSDTSARDLQPPPVGVGQREREVMEARHQPVTENTQYFECAGACGRFFALHARKAQDGSDGPR